MKKQPAVLPKYRRQGARIGTFARTKLKSKSDFSLWYTPGVGAAASHLALHPHDARQMSIKKNSVAVISDGSAVLGLGNLGPYGALPVMEGKALIFKEMADIDAWPLVLDTQDTEEIIQTIRAIAPAFGGINLEDISAPRCFEIEERLVKALDIPVMHDDQHGTAVVVLAGLVNAAKVVKKKAIDMKTVIAGAGAAGVAIANLLEAAGIRDITVLDRAGTIYRGRKDLPPHKRRLAAFTNPRGIRGGIQAALTGADVFIGVSGPDLVKKEDLAVMNTGAIVFALANPVPEVMPEVARAAGAAVIATGRSDFPNQLNNALVYPGLFRGCLDGGITKITEGMKLRAAQALAALVKKPTADHIIPDLLDKRVVKAISRAVR